MRTTLDLDDDLVREAMELTQIEETTKLVNEALRELIRRAAAERLIRLGGSSPDLKSIPRRRS